MAQWPVRSWGCTASENSTGAAAAGTIATLSSVHVTSKLCTLGGEPDQAAAQRQRGTCADRHAKREVPAHEWH